MFPDPLAAQVPPPAPRHVQVALVMAAGTVSATVAPFATLGPAFDATIVYVMDVPGTSVACPSVLVIERSAWGGDAAATVNVTDDTKPVSPGARSLKQICQDPSLLSPEKPAKLTSGDVGSESRFAKYWHCPSSPQTTMSVIVFPIASASFGAPSR